MCPSISRHRRPRSSYTVLFSVLSATCPQGCKRVYQHNGTTSSGHHRAVVGWQLSSSSPFYAFVSATNTCHSTHAQHYGCGQHRRSSYVDHTHQRKMWVLYCGFAVIMSLRGATVQALLELKATVHAHLEVEVAVHARGTKPTDFVFSPRIRHAQRARHRA